MAEGVQLLELARNARRLFEKQEAPEKRRLLDFLVSNCSWKAGQLTAEFRQPFDSLANTAMAAAVATAEDRSEAAKSEIWLPVIQPTGYMTRARFQRRIPLWRSTTSYRVFQSADTHLVDRQAFT